MELKMLEDELTILLITLHDIFFCFINNLTFSKCKFEVLILCNSTNGISVYKML
jgi:hypothetical protein